MSTNLDGVKIRVYMPVWMQVIEAEKDGIKGIYLDNLALLSSQKIILFDCYNLGFSYLFLYT